MYVFPLMSSQFHPSRHWGHWLDLWSVKQGTVQRYSQRIFQTQTHHHSMCSRAGCTWLYVKVTVMISIKLFIFSYRQTKAISGACPINDWGTKHLDFLTSAEQNQTRGVLEIMSVTILNKIYVSFLLWPGSWILFVGVIFPLAFI